jgi:transposase InsO family protein
MRANRSGSRSTLLCPGLLRTVLAVGGASGEGDYAYRQRIAVPLENLPQRATASGDPAEHSRTGSCLDGAAAEPFFATIKAEIGVEYWPGRAGARRDIENWIKTYSVRRLHSAVNYQTPTETRRTWQERMATTV